MTILTSRLPEFLYQGNDIPEILRLYETDLRKTGNIVDVSHAVAIKKYHDLIVDRKFLAVTRKEFECLYALLEKEEPNLRFYIEGRRKSLISSENKIMKLLNEKKSMDLFRDMFAFRIVLFGHFEEEELVKKCYSVMNQIITHYVITGHTLCEEDPVIETMAKDSPLLKQLVRLDHSEIETDFLYGVKDYILNPKENGYQSLHCVFRTQAGYCFEVQVRTLKMDVEATEGLAEHGAYKKTKYKYQVEFDRTKVHIPGYYISSNGSVYDHVGLEEPLSIIKRYKTF